MKLTYLIVARYLPHARRTLKPRTVAEYARLADKVILPAFGERLIASLTLEEIDTWHAGISGRVQANRALAVLSTVLTYAVNRRLLLVNPCRGAERNRERNVEFFYTPAQSKAILRVALSWPDIRGQYLALELLTGCRPSELLDMTPAWRTPGAVRLPDSKTGTRTIYLSGAAEALLDRLPAIYPRVGLTRAGKLREGQPRGDCYFPAGMDLRRAWEGIMRAAGVPRARQYDLRHTFASAALAAGIGLDVVGLMLGHRKRETTLRYAHLSPDIGVNAAAAAAARMGA